MPKSLSPQAVAEYHATGFRFPVPALAADEARSYRQRLEAFIEENGGSTGARKLLFEKAHLRCPPLAELVRHPKILDAVEDVLGPDILCWASTIFLKEPQDKAYVSWHQDAMYWGLDPADVVTAWVALTDSLPENGAMQVLPESHLGALFRHNETFAADNMLSRGQEIAVEVDPRKVVTLSLRAGEMSLHHIKLAHGSDANKSMNRRIGYAIRYVAPHVRQTGSKGDRAMLVRGNDKFKNFRPEISTEPT
jgi:ectoine hydroxylase-related dioxygenase (phytanoyl-CoA dioxygenase family)